jgi:hypothetical protein
MGTTTDTTKRIAAALNKRTGSAHWTCRHHRGTAYGWLTISAAPKFCTWHHEQVLDDRGMPIMDPMTGHYALKCVNDPSRPYGVMGPDDCAALARLLNKEHVHCQGESVPSDGDYYEEYIARAEGRTPERFGHQYWD